MAHFHTFCISQGDVAPPGAVVIPEMMVGIECATGDESEMFSRHVMDYSLVFVGLDGFNSLAAGAKLGCSSF